MTKADKSSLEAAVFEMDAMCKHSVSRIKMLSQLAMNEMERGQVDLSLVFVALQTIKDEASTLGNLVNAEASDVGCNQVDMADINRTARLRGQSIALMAEVQNG